GPAAIGRLQASAYAVVVVDLMMPIFDGLALVEYIKQQPGPRPAIIVVSAGDPASLRRFDGSVVHSIVRKPFDIDVLGELIVAAARTAAEANKEEGKILPFPQDRAC